MQASCVVICESDSVVAQEPAGPRAPSVGLPAALGPGDEEPEEEEGRCGPAPHTLGHAAVGQPEASAGPGLGWVLLGISSHLAWGLYPVLARYLQTVRGFDGLLVLSVTFIVSLCVVQISTCSGFGGVASVRVGSLYSLLTLSRAVTNMLSCKYTLALYAQLITQLGPFVTAILSHLFLREGLPRCIAPALLASTLGAVLAVLGQADLDVSALSRADALGILLALLSVNFSAGMRIFMKSTSATLSEPELISWQYTNAVPLGVAAALTMSPSAWGRVSECSAADAAVLLAFVLVIGLFATFSQVVSVRHLGATFASSLQPVRLISTVVGAYLALGERVHSSVAWAGLLLITAAISLYLCAQGQGAPALPRVEPAARPSLRAAGATKYGRVANH